VAGGGDPGRAGAAVALRRPGDGLPVLVGQLGPVEGEEHQVLARAFAFGRRDALHVGLRVSRRARQGQQRDADKEQRFHPEPPGSLWDAPSSR
jgi:hypothetical protein